MSRTRHHSRKWGPDHRWAPDRRDRAGYSGSSRAGEAPGWHVALYDERPGRREDDRILRAILCGDRDADGVIFARYGTRKPHSWFW